MAKVWVIGCPRRAPPSRSRNDAGPVSVDGSLCNCTIGFGGDAPGDCTMVASRVKAHGPDSSTVLPSTIANDDADDRDV